MLQFFVAAFFCWFVPLYFLFDIVRTIGKHGGAYNHCRFLETSASYREKYAEKTA